MPGPGARAPGHTPVWVQRRSCGDGISKAIGGGRLPRAGTGYEISSNDSSIRSQIRSLFRKPFTVYATVLTAAPPKLA